MAWELSEVGDRIAALEQRADAIERIQVQVLGKLFAASELDEDSFKAGIDDLVAEYTPKPGEKDPARDIARRYLVWINDAFNGRAITD